MRWSRNRAFAMAPHVDVWPSINIDILSVEERDRFIKASAAVKLYANGESGKEIYRRTGIISNDLPRISARCLTLASDGQILGFRALVPFLRLRPYQKKELAGAKRQEQQGGHSGSLGYVLSKFPDFQMVLVAHVRQESKYLGVSEHKISGTKLHNVFVLLLKEKVKAGLYPETGWPFNTKYRGLRTIQKYMRELVYVHFSRSVSKRSEADARAHLNVGKGTEPLLRFDEPFDAVEIDSHVVHVHSGVKFKTPEGTEQIVPIERFWVIAAVDRVTTAILAWLAVYRSEVSASDVVRLISNAIFHRWQPREFTIPDFKYENGAGLPSGTIEEAAGAVWALTMFDNALAHLSNKVCEETRRQLGFAINLGPPGHFERRPNVERTFLMLEKELERLPSTTGSNPQKGRAQAPIKAVLKHEILADEIEQIIEQILTRHNVTPNSGVSYHSPLNLLRYYLCGDPILSEPRKLPMTEHSLTTGLVTSEKRTVRGGVKNGRRPYVQIDGVHYTNPVLGDTGELIGTILIVQIDEDDMRNVHAYLEDGTDFGILTAAGRWSLSKHSRQTRRIINSLITQRILAVSEFDDPVQVYLKFKGTPTAAPKKNKPPLSAAQASEVARVSKEAGVEPQIHSHLPPEKKTQTLSEAAARPALLKRSQEKPRRLARNRR